MHACDIVFNLNLFYKPVIYFALQFYFLSICFSYHMCLFSDISIADFYIISTFFYFDLSLQELCLFKICLGQ